MLAFRMDKRELTAVRPGRGCGALLAAASLVLAACRSAEPPEVAQARLQKVVYEQQIASLEKLLAEAQRGDVVRPDRLAVGIEESVVRELVNATLPREVKVGNELTVLMQTAQAYFRFTKAGVLVEGRLSSTRFPDHFVNVQLLGVLDDVKLDKGRFAARVKLVNAQIQGVSLGTMAKDLLDRILKDHLSEIEDAIPAFEVPVRLEQAIAINGLGDGPVSVRPGRLPLEMSVARLLPAQERLWVMVDVKVGPWQRQGDASLAKTPDPEQGAPKPPAAAPSTNGATP
jgi:hypothetical protein